MKMNENEKFECGLSLKDVELCFRDFMEECDYSISDCDPEFNLVCLRKITFTSITEIEVNMEILSVKKRWRRKSSSTICTGSLELKEMKSLVRVLDKIDNFKTLAFINSKGRKCRK